MAKANSNMPRVRIVDVKNRTLQLRYRDPDTGKEVRFSAGTHCRKQAELERKTLQKRLNRGERPRPLSPQKQGRLTWEEFREQYARLKQFRTEAARRSAEDRLNVCEGIVKPKTIEKMANTNTLTWLQAELASTRSPHSVSSYMGTLTAALNWAHKMGWLPHRVTFERLQTGRLESLKGRPLTNEEFRRMLEACDTVCSQQDPASWKYLLRGLWNSGLRLGEILSVN